MVVLLFVAVGVALAFMFQKKEVKNIFAPAQVSCTVHEKYQDHLKENITVENTGNIPSYIRVRLVSYYEYENGNVAGVKAPEISFLHNTDAWIRGRDGIYYYKDPLQPGERTDVMGGPLYLADGKDAEGSTVYQVVEILAEPEKAVIQSWGVTLQDGHISEK